MQADSGHAFSGGDDVYVDADVPHGDAYAFSGGTLSERGVALPVRELGRSEQGGPGTPSSDGSPRSESVIAYETEDV